MNNVEFMNYVQENIKNYLPASFSDADVQINTVKKSNGVCMKGLVIRTQDKNITPTIYLEKFFEDYENGACVDEILKKIADIRLASDAKKDFDPGFFADLEKVKDRIYPRIIGKAAWNSELLIMRPYVRWMDLIINFVIDMYDMFDGKGTASATITNHMMEMWEIDKYQLQAMALSNLKKGKMMKADIRNMFDILKEMVITEDAELMIPEGDNSMYVLSNESRCYGASVAINKEILKKIHDRIGAFVMIPSSVHEWIIVKYEDSSQMDAISQMIKEINASTVDQNEWLSDHPYIYKDGEVQQYE